MTLEEIEIAIDNGEFSNKLSTILELLLEIEDVDSEDIELFINEFDEDETEYEFESNYYLVLSDDEINDRASWYVDNNICEYQRSLKKSDVSFLDNYINWEKLESSEIDDYIDDFEGIEDVQFMSSRRGYNIYLR